MIIENVGACLNKFELIRNNVNEILNRLKEMVQCMP